MLTNYGFRAFLESMAKPYDCRLWTQGSRWHEIFKCDAGYPKVGDTDESNANRGEFVLTWRFTIPRGTSWGQSPANEAELLEADNIVYRTAIPDLYTSANHPTVLYLNMMLRKS